MDISLIDFLREWLRPLIGIFAFDYGRYLLAALVVTLVLGTLGRYRMGRTVRTRTPEPGQRRQEFLHSTLSAAIFASMGFAVFQGSQLGIFRVYGDIAAFGWAYWVFSLGLIVVAHDAYFYWTHRLLHLRGVFDWTHRQHHRSVAPTQWTAYSFSVAEAFVQTAFAPLLLLVVPMHGFVMFLWMAHQILRNVVQHCGVELLPGSWLAGAWGKWMTTTLHHDLHHAHGRSNYGLYFTWWDRWCGTEHVEYRARLRQLIDTISDRHVSTNSDATPSTGSQVSL